MFGLSPLRLALYGVALASLLGAVWVVNGWRQDSNKLDAAEAELAQVIADVAERERLRTKQDGISTRKANDYETQLADARKTNAELAGRHQPVRVCRNPPSVPRVATAATEPVTTPSEGLQPEAGPDIAPDIYVLALEADECSVRLSNLQGWITEQLLVH